MIAKNRKLSRNQLFGLIGCGSCLLIVVCSGILGIFLFKAMLVSIEPTERGVVISLYEKNGYRLETWKPGYHFLKPGEKVILFDISHQTYDTRGNPSTNQADDSVTRKTRDGQKVEVDISITYIVNLEKVVELYKTWSTQYEAGLVRPQSRFNTRDVIAQYTFDEISVKHA